MSLFTAMTDIFKTLPPITLGALSTAVSMYVSREAPPAKRSVAHSWVHAYPHLMRSRKRIISVPFHHWPLLATAFVVMVALLLN